MQCRELLVLGLLGGCGRVGFDARPDAGSEIPGDGGPRYADLVLASSPVAYYRLAESGGTTAVDASGNDNAGAYDADLGTIQYARPGALTTDANTAVRFDADGNPGPTTSASVGVPSSFVDWSADFTVEMFYLPHQAPPINNSNVVFVCESYLINGFRVGWNVFENLHVWTDEAGGNGGLMTSVPLSMTTFSHIAIVQQAAQFTLYVEGVAVGSAPLTYIPADSSSECGFGALHGMPGYSTNDEVALYPRALGPGEIAAHAAAR